MNYYLRTISKEAFLQDLRLSGININLEGKYYQDENIIIDWLGEIPYPSETEEEITYREGQHVNIRSVEDIDISKFENTVQVFPKKPYRTFS
jgi:hypothetical protein